MTLKDNELVPIERWILRLASEFLDEYSDRLSNDGCNDYDIPSYVPKKKLKQMILDAHGGTEEDADAMMGGNDMVTAALAEVLSEKGSKP